MSEFQQNDGSVTTAATPHPAPADDVVDAVPANAMAFAPCCKREFRRSWLIIGNYTCIACARALIVKVLS